MRIGDCTRRRRFDPLRQRWYAIWRAFRHSRRLLGTPTADALLVYKAASQSSARPNPQ